MYQSILVPLDGSSFGEHALPPALSLARRLKAALQVIQVHVPPWGLYSKFGGPHDKSVDQAIREREQEYLDGVVTRITGIAGIPANSALLDGPVAEVIDQYAANIQADLLIMTTQGRGPFGRFWLGSVSDELVRQAGIPILFVRPQEAIADLSQESEFRRVLIPLDGSQLAERVLEPVVALGSGANPEYTLLRVIKQMTPASYDPTSGRVSGLRESLLKQLQELDQQESVRAHEYLQELTSRLRARSLTVKSRVVSHERPAVAILEDAQKSAIDLIALATHGLGGLKRMLLGSVADKVLRGTTTPILVCRSVDGSMRSET